jgi:acetylornithine deacetylase/succinyl-diaminopimelate desuccinylase-like protein
VIPAVAWLGLDLRGISLESLRRLDAAIRAAAAEIADRRRIGVDVRLVREGSPTRLDPGLVREALSAADRLGVAASVTWSGAGHDSQHLASLTATLLLLVPLSGGESHTPFEEADPCDIVNALQVADSVLTNAR